VRRLLEHPQAAFGLTCTVRHHLRTTEHVELVHTLELPVDRPVDQVHRLRLRLWLFNVLALERLLAEQRQKLQAENSDLKKRAQCEAEERHASGAELSRLRDESERKSQADEAEIKKLREELRKLTAPPPPPPKPKEKPKPKGLIDLDESPDAPPIAEQLANALRENSTRVLDLFRSWDADGDGQVSRAEFHKAMAALGLEVEKQIIDDLFSEWDKDGGGELGYNELVKILRAPRPAMAAPGAAAAMKGKLKK